MVSVGSNKSVDGDFSHFECFLKECLAEDPKLIAELAQVPDNAKRSKRVQLILNRYMQAMISGFCNPIETTKLCSHAARLGDKDSLSTASTTAAVSPVIGISAASSLKSASGSSSTSSACSEASVKDKVESDAENEREVTDEEDVFLFEMDIGKPEQK